LVYQVFYQCFGKILIVKDKTLQTTAIRDRIFTMIKKIKFAENLRNLRRGAGITQKQLAGVLEIDQRTVSAWENEICEPSFALLAKLCEFFGETFDSILT